MRVLLVQLDGALPNIALMRLAAHHGALGDEVELHRGRLRQQLLFFRPDRVYASLIFEKTRPVADELRRVYPDAIVGGTGWDVASKLEDHGITTLEQDYSLYPRFDGSIGFTQRGCRLRCSFCVVPKKEGAVRDEKTIWEIWRGESWPRELILLDNDFFGQLNWRERIREIREGDFKVSFSQGINARFLSDETAEAIASIKYRDDGMKNKRIYTAWDNRKDEERLFRGLALLKKNGVDPDHIMVYILIGFWDGETDEDWEYRRSRLRAFGARPYPMPYLRTKATVGFQRYCVGAYDKRVSWKEFEAADYEPRNLRLTRGAEAELPMEATNAAGV